MKSKLVTLDYFEQLDLIHLIDSHIEKLKYESLQFSHAKMQAVNRLEAIRNKLV